MGIEQDIEAIRSGIKAGRFSNEASVSQGIVLRLLNALGWPSYDTDSVWPEYSLSGRRVDFALCSPPGKPIAFIEVKQVGQSGGAERQLFEYAFHDGVPMAILTDGQEWNFFLPGEQGDYGERRVYKLDIVDRDVKECVERLERYLKHSAVASGVAIQAARDDYRNVSKDRQMRAALSKAWSQIILDEDELLLEIVADRAESLCGFKPGPDMVSKFLKDFMSGRDSLPMPIHHPIIPASSAKPAEQPLRVSVPRPAPRPGSANVGGIGFTFEGKFYPAKNAIDTLRKIFDKLIERDANFGDRFAGLPKHGRSRRYLARDANELYPGRLDLASEYSIKLESPFWMGTNHSKNTINCIIEMACGVAQISFNQELVANLGE